MADTVSGSWSPDVGRKKKSITWSSGTNVITATSSRPFVVGRIIHHNIILDDLLPQTAEVPTMVVETEEDTMTMGM